MSTTLSTGVSVTPGRWTLDLNHSSISFTIRHLGLSKVHGRFDRFEATFDAGPALAESYVTATVDLASVNTNQPDRDAHLRTTEFFSIEQHPEMVFVSTGIRSAGKNWTLAGNLTLNGVTQPVTFDVEFNGIETFPGDQKRHAGFTATGSIRRSAFGIELGLIPLGGAKLMLGDEVKIEIDVQFVEPETAAS